MGVYVGLFVGRIVERFVGGMWGGMWMQFRSLLEYERVGSFCGLLVGALAKGIICGFYVICGGVFRGVFLGVVGSFLRDDCEGSDVGFEVN